MSEVGRPGQLVDPIKGGDVVADGTLLSVAEIQQRLREERARRGLAAAARATCHASATRPTAPAIPPIADTATPDPGTAAAIPTTATAATSVRSPATVSVVKATAEPSSERVPTGNGYGQRQLPSAPGRSRLRAAHSAPAASSTAPAASGTDARRRLDIPADWVRVLAGHSGAGASTVALALADAAAATGRSSQVIEAASPSRSGLISAASRELDVDESGAWRRGSRPHSATSVSVTITRRAGDRQPFGWPTIQAAGELLVAVDLGLVPTDAVAGVAGGLAVVVCRATIPGVRLTEQLLDRLADSTVVVVAMLGGRRWPGEVTASAGRRLRALRDADRVVTVPLDGHLAVTGLTHVPLPKAVLAGGRALLGLIDAAGPGGVNASPTLAQPAPRQKGTTR